jgi:hypothetical protein
MEYSTSHAMRRISVPAGEKDSSHGVSSVASAIQGQNSTLCSWWNSYPIADITELVASNLSAPQRLSESTPTAMPGAISHCRPAPRRTTQTESMCHIVSSPTSGIASTPTLPSGFESLPTPISNPEAHTIITNPLQMRATERYQS